MKKVIFLCVNNSCRSQMAEGLLRYHGGGRYEVHSAGSEPTKVNKNAVKVMSELGIDINGQRSKSMDEYELNTFDYVITTCEEAYGLCPVVDIRVNIIQLDLEDPAKKTGSEQEVLEEFKKIRDEIEELILKFISAEAENHQ